MSGPSRRRVLALSGAAASVAALSLRTTPLGALPVARHALTVFGDPLYGPDAPFGYVNPDAPRGGEIRLSPVSWRTNQNPETFNTFNMFILKGDSPPFMDRCHAALMVRGLDEPDAVYGQLAESVEIDGRRYAFRLRPATFSDGSPITAADVAFSYAIIRDKGHYTLAQPLAGVRSVEAADDATVVITFADDASNRLPPLVTSEPYAILSQAFYTANDFTAAKLDVPVTSGPYIVGEFRAGQWLNFEKRPAYWGDAIPSGRGHNNFDRIRVDFFRERQVSFEAFKSGRTTYREEYTSKTWATEYNFPAVRDSRVILREFPDGRPAGAQGIFMNTRRPLLADRRVREAIGHCFDFEWANANLFYGAYNRTHSFFMNSDMLATGVPSAEEVVLLAPFRDRLDPAVFGPAWTAPVTDGTGRDRGPLRRAGDLLASAGFTRRGDGQTSASGERLALEFLYEGDPATERIMLPFQSRLRLVGIDIALRAVDGAQMQSRINAFDFDLTTQRFAFSPTPDEAIRAFFTSAAAGQNGSYNLAGIRDAVVDALLESMLAAPSRAEMVTAARAMDRVLRLGHYWVPQWNKGVHTVAYWDEFGIPETTPRYDLPVETTWWAKAK